MTARTLRLAVMLSGSGTTLQNLIDRIADGRLTGVEIALVISSRSTVAGVERARRAGLPPQIIRTKDFDGVEAFSAAIVERLDAARVDLVVLAGWLCYWVLPQRWIGRVLNMHPALLPSFGGQGMYGHHVHEAVLARGCKVTGCTVHLVNNEYDAGPIVAQACVPVAEDDTPDTLAQRVMAAERELYPRAIELFRDGRLTVEGRRVKVRGERRVVNDEA